MKFELYCIENIRNYKKRKKSNPKFPFPAIQQFDRSWSSKTVQISGEKSGICSASVCIQWHFKLRWQRCFVTYITVTRYFLPLNCHLGYALFVTLHIRVTLLFSFLFSFFSCLLFACKFVVPSLVELSRLALSHGNRMSRSD